VIRLLRGCIRKALSLVEQYVFFFNHCWRLVSIYLLLIKIVNLLWLWFVTSELLKHIVYVIHILGVGRILLTIALAKRSFLVNVDFNAIEVKHCLIGLLIVCNGIRSFNLCTLTIRIDWHTFRYTVLLSKASWLLLYILLLFITYSWLHLFVAISRSITMVSESVLEWAIRYGGINAWKLFNLSFNSILHKMLLRVIVCLLN